ncbi:OsmC family protein [Occallatibacter savannae]|uniref:OsmC family protein n=1 Tax=Occallatibacter savannae TaxID=1002691 RepID=UPI000D695EBE|nr:OsmC family protein [Occallatibacter savannae]
MQTELIVHAAHEGGMRVRASAGGFDVLMDYPAASSEPLAGPTPLTMLLASLAACSVNSLMVVLKKMQQPVSGLSVEARAIRSTGHPTVLTNIFLEFTVKGDAVDPAAVGRALQLSEERLCPVWNMLKASTEICAEFHVEHDQPSQMPTA